jgi:hypothetical protein
VETIQQDVFSEPVTREDLDRIKDKPLVVHQRKSGNGKVIVVFVHGLGGSRYGENSTWGNFPKFIYDDFVDIDVGLYEFALC